MQPLRKNIALIGMALAVLTLACLAYSLPDYFASQTYMGGLLLVEVLIAVVWMYRRVFFPALVLSFLWAGISLPGGGGIFSVVRWLFLGTGAAIGLLIVLRERSLHFAPIHLIALVSIGASFVSITVSRYPQFTLLKVLSVLLLFVYAMTGARIAVVGRQDRFGNGLLKGFEIFVGAIALLHAFGIRAMGNPNSLGAAMCLAAPILLWGMLLGGNPIVRGRRLILYLACMFLLFVSQARAGILAALISCILMCWALRKYKLVGQGVIVFVIVVATIGILRPKVVPSYVNSVVFKQSSGELLASRLSPWQAAIDRISANPWFGTGFGTTDAEGAEVGTRNVASSATMTAENGSSYLSILAGVGVLGSLPWLLLLSVVMHKIVKTVLWMRRYGSAFHPAVPIAMLLVAGSVHAAFEDWMFAPGYYLCVFFWCMTFILVDMVSGDSSSRQAAPSSQEFYLQSFASPQAPHS